MSNVAAKNSVAIQGCHKNLDCLKQSQNYYAVIHVKVLSPIDPHGKVSSESWDTQTHTIIPWPGFHQPYTLMESILRNPGIRTQTYSGLFRYSTRH